MTQPNAVASFFTGGGRGITWPDAPPKTVSGTITMVHPPEPVMDPKTGQPTEKQQIRIELSTNERNPEIEFDDGSRTLYVKSYMRGAIGDALKKVGEKEPKIGGTLTVAFVRLEPPERPGLSASKHFEAVYQPPAVTGEFFGNGSGQAAQAGATAAQAAAAYAAAPPQPAPVQQPQYQQAPVPAAVPQQPVQPAPAPQYAAAPAAPAAPGPQKPPQMSDAAWAAMDPATQAAVASALGAPPF